MAAGWAVSISRASARPTCCSLTPEEWNTFIECVVTGYCDHLRELAASDSEPSRRHERGGAVLMVTENFMARYGERLVSNGYAILPIQPGTKKPGRHARGKWHGYR